nr:acyl CoA:acetate/3-ketoacid CoA transferase [Alphaproteobacteria bacterium]
GGFINISQNARKLVFAGTFTAGGLRVAIEDGAVRIEQYGRSQKFKAAVEQITFSGEYAAELDRPVLYVTERCVFRLRADGVELVEVAPGIDIERDILQHMDFEPIIGSPKTMDRRIFVDEPMDLRSILLDLDLSDRISYDTERNTLFLNFEGLHVRRTGDIEAIRNAVEARCQEIGKRVAVVVNYDAFKLDEQVADAYADMVRDMEQRLYTQVSRYTTSAFMRMKLGKILTRTVAPHIFESRSEAQAFHGQ